MSAKVDTSETIEQEEKSWGYSEKDMQDWSILDHHNSIPHDWRAVGEYLDRLENKDIPTNSRLVLALVEGTLSNGEVISRYPVKMAILPANEIRILESSTNSDILQREIEETGSLPFKGKMLELTITARETEFPADLVPEGFAKCKECGNLFKKEGKRVFHTEQCRSRFHVRQTRKRKKAASS